MLTRRDFFRFSAGVVGALALPGMAATRDGRPPNILVIVADDLRWDALGFAGSRVVRTPYLDRLAETSLVYRNAFVTTSVCPVSRASIMSGQYASRHGIWDFETPFNAAQLDGTYHARLRGAGYHTGFIGKWGLGGPLPVRLFDRFEGFSNYMPYIDAKRTPPHLTTYQGEAALGFLSSTPRDRPFCLTVCFFAPHAQNELNDEFPPEPGQEHLYDGPPIPPPPTFSTRYLEGLPKSWIEPNGRSLFDNRIPTSEKFQNFLRGYFRLITGMDAAIGRILSALAGDGRLDNTLVLFLSDNGFFLGDHGMIGKWLIYEESIRVPLVLRLPVTAGSALRGLRQTFALNIDVAPTLLRAAGVAIPASMQGVALQDIEASAPYAARSSFFYEYKAGPFQCLGIRTERWKYGFFPETGFELLFDLLEDPYEQENRAGRPAHLTLVAGFKKTILARYRFS